MNRKNYISSNEIKKLKKISSCELMHSREEGKLKFFKKGNSYMYERPKLNSKNKLH